MKTNTKKHSMDRCVTCGKKVNRNKAYTHVTYSGEKYLACCPLCQAEFEKDQEKYIAEADRRGNRK